MLSVLFQDQSVLSALLPIYLLTNIGSYSVELSGLYSLISTNHEPLTALPFLVLGSGHFSDHRQARWEPVIRSSKSDSAHHLVLVILDHWSDILDVFYFQECLACCFTLIEIDISQTLLQPYVDFLADGEEQGR